MSRIYRRRNNSFGIFAIIFIVIAIVIIATVLYVNKNKEEPYVPPVQEEPKASGETSTLSTIIKIDTKDISSYEGYWVDILLGGTSYGGSDLWLYYKSDDTFDLDFIDSEKNISFEEDDVKIINNSASFVVLNYSCILTINEKIINFTVKDSSNSYEYLFEKKSNKIISRKELFDAIDNVIKSRYQYIDSTILRYKNDNNFIALGLVPTCFIKNRDAKSTYDGVDYLRDVYTVDKTKNKLITIGDLIEDEEHARRVDKYILEDLERQKDTALDSGYIWPYPAYLGVLSPYNNASKYFYVEEEAHVVHIKAYEKMIVKDEETNEVWCTIPFEYIFNDERLIKMGIEPLSFESGDSSGDVL